MIGAVMSMADSVIIQGEEMHWSDSARVSIYNKIVCVQVKTTLSGLKHFGSYWRLHPFDGQ